MAPALGLSTAPRGGPPRLGGLSLNIAAAANPQGVDLQKLRTASNGSSHFHGSRSGSLIAFHESTPPEQRGALRPMGALRDAGAPVLSGERGNSLQPNAFNSQHLSVVDERHVDAAIEYAKDKSAARQSPVLGASAGDALSGTTEVKTKMAETANKALDQLKTSDPAMHALVSQNFPVLYGLKPDAGKIVGVSSSVQGEVGIQGGVKPSEIGAVFVPDEHVAQVQALMQKSGTAVPVRPMSAYAP